MYMMAYSVRQLANTLHQVRLLIYMIGYAVHLNANAVHPSEAPKVHVYRGLYSVHVSTCTIDG